MMPFNKFSVSVSGRAFCVLERGIKAQLCLCFITIVIQCTFILSTAAAATPASDHIKSQYLVMQIYLIKWLATGQCKCRRLWLSGEM